MKKIYKKLLSLIVCVALGFTFAMGAVAEENNSDNNIKVAFAGDSICIGYEGYYGFPNVTIDNYGVGGDTTEDVLQVVKGIKGDYDKLFLICGVNDCTNDDWLDETFVDSMANFRGMFEAVKENMPNTKIYVTGIFPTLGRQKHLVPTSIKYNAALKQLIEEYDNVVFVGDACWNALLDSETGLGKAEYYKKDGLHPIKEGYDVLNEVLTPYMYDYKDLDGNVYYQVNKSDNSMLRFVAEMNIEDVQNAESGSYVVKLNGSDVLINIDVSNAYKSIMSGGNKITAPEGKCYIITSVMKNCRAGDEVLAEFNLDGFYNGISRVITIK